MTKFITPSHTIRKYTSRPLSGVPEWRAKFSTPPGNATGELTSSPYKSALPLLLFPFEPRRVLLPGQRARLTFRHGKFMDMIDESLSSYESVVGMSILDDDGLLPVIVLCEVFEEEVEVKSGFRGVLSMNVGLRAVETMKRWDGAQGAGYDVENEEKARGSDLGDAVGGITALDEIHLGKFVDFEDDLLTSDEIKAAHEYLANIASLLNLPSLPTSTSGQELTVRQKLFFASYNSMLERYDATGMSRNQSQIIAASWAVFSTVEDDDKISSVICRALTTKNAVERLRLGLATMLDSTMPVADDYNESNAFQ
ncbi:hypothetical protein HJC23_011379 [Cyclotella cryptica]|uniref:Lon N-terminal domain-containing protein n=1 Tax=Cyclotella cryptica TaxID=29204 RepID=A0ABD3PQA7_9STRA|eukprot:CCRYP_012649-RA/>CCRYP_012649-RA protein AED:0.04 eAED:0.04 QI:0/-1/0/1/-1/1/1/0/310